MDRTEAAAAIEYAEIAAEYGVPVTLFLTGKVVREEPDRVQELAGMDNVELGGHNYYAFGTLAHKGFRALFGSWHGPRRVQAWEIRRTMSAFAERGVDISAWRDHAYRYDDNTAELLAECGITHFSDAVGPDESVRRTANLTIVPINTPPDHEHVYHGFRTPKFVATDDFSGPFGDASREVDAWRDWVLGCVDDRFAAGTPATILAHPHCMDLADSLAAFETLCETLAAEYTPVRVSEVSAD
jgi:hypothetical protein